MRPSAIAIAGAGAALAGCAMNHAERTGPVAIHQEVHFDAPPDRVYRAIMDPDQFARVTGRPVDHISPGAGGTFSCFDGIIIGRHIELVPNHLIVQAWREGVWDPGVYSIARFEMKPEAGGTRLIFDHTGFPEGSGAHLKIGWYENYWDPLKRYLGQ